MAKMVDMNSTPSRRRRESVTVDEMTERDPCEQDQECAMNSSMPLTSPILKDQPPCPAEEDGGRIRRRCGCR